MWDGVQGYSFLTVAREAVAVGLAIEQYTGRFFANDARPGVVYTHPKTLSDAARENLRKSLQAAHEGVGNAWRFALLEEGMTVTTIPAEDARFLEAAKFQRNQIASLFRIPPHMLGDLERATHSNVEQQSLEFVIYTLAPWLVRWEQAIGLQLLGDEWVGAGGDLFVEFLVDGLLRGDTSTRYAAYHMARLDGWLSADEIRERENLNPLPDGAGETYWTPLNVTTSGPDGTTISATLAQPARSSPAGGEG
jgi:HK97 family phage portal protein